MDNAEQSEDTEAIAATAAPPSLREGMRAGGMYLMTANVASKAFKALVHLVLAWLLVEEDYGLYGLALTVLLFLLLMSEFGVGVAVIRKKEMDPSFPNAAFWLNIGVSVLMMIVACLVAPVLARLYADPRVTLLVQISSLGFVVTALRTVPMALLRRQLRFRSYAVLETIWHVLTGILTIIMAVAGAGYWSFVVPSIISGLVMAPLWCRAARWRPTFSIRWGVMHDVFGYSKYVVAVSMLSLLLSNGGYAIAGYLLQDTERVGYYTFAMEYSMYIVINFAWLVGNVSLPGFALRQDTPDTLRTAFAQIFEVLAALTLPIHALMFALTPLLFDGILPDRWEPVMPYFQILIVYAAIRALGAHAIPFYNAVKKADIALWYYCAFAPIALVAMYIGCKSFDLMGLAITTSAVLSLGIIVLLVLTPYWFGWRPIGYARLSTPYVIASAIAAGAAYGVGRAITAQQLHAIVALVVGGGAGVCIYAVVLYLIARERLRQVLAHVLPKRAHALAGRFLPGIL